MHIIPACAWKILPLDSESVPLGFKHTQILPFSWLVAEEAIFSTIQIVTVLGA